MPFNSQAVVDERADFFASQWALYHSPYPSAEHSVAGTEFLQVESVNLILELAKQRLGCDKPKVAASQFTKWYCRAHCGILYSLSMEDLAAGASLKDITVLFPGEPPFAVGISGNAVPVSYFDSRDEIRAETVKALFAGNFNIVFSALVRLTGIRPDILWDNAAVYIHYFYRTWIEETVDESRKSILRDDYDYVIKNAEAALFGADHQINPLFGSCAPFRNTCCLRVQIPGLNKCKGCPLQEREQPESHIEAQS